MLAKPRTARASIWVWRQGLPPAFTDPLMEIVRLARAMPHEPESLSIDLGDGPKALALLGASADTMHVSVKRHGIMWRGNLACSRCEDWRFGSVEGDEQTARLASLIAKVGEPGAGVSEIRPCWPDGTPCPWPEETDDA